MRILVTGSRSWTDEERIRFILEGYFFYKNVMEWDVFNYQLPTVTIVSGGARGADILCEKIAKEKNWVIEQHIPDWKKFSRSAGFVRNDYMISLGADACFSFIKDDSAGATHTANGAVKAGIPTRIIGIRNGVEYEDRCSS